MTLLQKLEKRNFGTLGSYTGQSIVDPAAIPPPGMGGSTAAGMLVNETTAMTIDAVQTALNIIVAGIIKRGDLRAYTETIGTAGQCEQAWQQTPDPFLQNSFAYAGPNTNSQSRGRMQTVISMALFGEAWWFELTTNPRTNATSSVDVLHPALLNIKHDRGNVAYEYGVGNNKVELDPTKLYHIERMGLPNHDRAISNIKEASVTYGIALAAMQYTSLFFSQGAQVPYIITSDSEMQDDVANRVAQKFRVEHSGIRQAHIPVFSGANLKVQTIGTDPNSAQNLATLEYVRTCIGSMFGIPQHLLGGANDKGNVWGQGYEEISMQMEDMTFTNYVVPIEEAHSDLLPGNLKAAWPQTQVRATVLNLGQAVQFMRQANVLTPNEIRSMYFGLGDWTGGDSDGESDGDKLIIPMASNTAPEQTTLGNQDNGTAGSVGDDSSDNNDYTGQ